MGATPLDAGINPTIQQPEPVRPPSLGPGAPAQPQPQVDPAAEMRGFLDQVAGVTPPQDGAETFRRTAEDTLTMGDPLRVGEPPKPVKRIRPYRIYEKPASSVGGMLWQEITGHRLVLEEGRAGKDFLPGMYSRTVWVPEFEGDTPDDLERRAWKMAETGHELHGLGYYGLKFLRGATGGLDALFTDWVDRKTEELKGSSEASGLLGAGAWGLGMAVGALPRAAKGVMTLARPIVGKLGAKIGAVVAETAGARLAPSVTEVVEKAAAKIPATHPAADIIRGRLLKLGRLVEQAGGRVSPMTGKIILPEGQEELFKRLSYSLGRTVEMLGGRKLGLSIVLGEGSIARAGAEVGAEAALRSLGGATILGGMSVGPEFGAAIRGRQSFGQAALGVGKAAVAGALLEGAGTPLAAARRGAKPIPPSPDAAPLTGEGLYEDRYFLVRDDLGRLKVRRERVVTVRGLSRARRQAGLSDVLETEEFEVPLDSDLWRRAWRERAGGRTWLDRRQFEAIKEGAYPRNPFVLESHASDLRAASEELAEIVPASEAGSRLLSPREGESLEVLLETERARGAGKEIARVARKTGRGQVLPFRKASTGPSASELNVETPRPETPDPVSAPPTERARVRNRTEGSLARAMEEVSEAAEQTADPRPRRTAVELNDAIRRFNATEGATLPSEVAAAIGGAARAKLESVADMAGNPMRGAARVLGDLKGPDGQTLVDGFFDGKVHSGNVASVPLQQTVVRWANDIGTIAGAYPEVKLPPPGEDPVRTVVAAAEALDSAGLPIPPVIFYGPDGRIGVTWEDLKESGVDPATIITSLAAGQQLPVHIPRVPVGPMARPRRPEIEQVRRASEAVWGLDAMQPLLVGHVQPADSSPPVPIWQSDGRLYAQDEATGTLVDVTGRPLGRALHVVESGGAAFVPFEASPVRYDVDERGTLYLSGVDERLATPLRQAVAESVGASPHPAVSASRLQTRLLHPEPLNADEVEKFNRLLDELEQELQEPDFADTLAMNPHVGNELDDVHTERVEAWLRSRVLLRTLRKALNARRIMDGIYPEGVLARLPSERMPRIRGDVNRRNALFDATVGRYEGNFVNTILRELVQNAVGAVRRRWGSEAVTRGRIEVSADLEKGELVISDNGDGMSAEELQKHFLSLANPPERAEGERRATPGGYGLGVKIALVYANATIKTSDGKTTSILTTDPHEYSRDLSGNLEAGPRKPGDPRGTTIVLRFPDYNKYSHLPKEKRLFRYVNEPMDPKRGPQESLAENGFMLLDSIITVGVATGMMATYMPERLGVSDISFSIKNAEDVEKGPWVDAYVPPNRLRRASRPERLRHMYTDIAENLGAEPAPGYGEGLLGAFAPIPVLRRVFGEKTNLPGSFVEGVLKAFRGLYKDPDIRDWLDGAGIPGEYLGLVEAPDEVHDRIMGTVFLGRGGLDRDKSRILAFGDVRTGEPIRVPIRSLFVTAAVRGLPQFSFSEVRKGPLGDPLLIPGISPVGPSIIVDLHPTVSERDPAYPFSPSRETFARGFGEYFRFALQRALNDFGAGSALKQLADFLRNPNGGFLRTTVPVSYAGKKVPLHVGVYLSTTTVDEDLAARLRANRAFQLITDAVAKLEAQVDTFRGAIPAAVEEGAGSGQPGTVHRWASSRENEPFLGWEISREVGYLGIIRRVPENLVRPDMDSEKLGLAGPPKSVIMISLPTVARLSRLAALENDPLLKNDEERAEALVEGLAAFVRLAMHTTLHEKAHGHRLFPHSDPMFIHRLQTVFAAFGGHVVESLIHEVLDRTPLDSIRELAGIFREMRISLETNPENFRALPMQSVRFPLPGEEDGNADSGEERAGDGSGAAVPEPGSGGGIGGGSEVRAEPGGGLPEGPYGPARLSREERAALGGAGAVVERVKWHRLPGLENTYVPLPSGRRFSAEPFHEGERPEQFYAFSSRLDSVLMLDAFPGEMLILHSSARYPMARMNRLGEGFVYQVRRLPTREALISYRDGTLYAPWPFIDALKRTGHDVEDLKRELLLGPVNPDVGWLRPVIGATFEQLRRMQKAGHPAWFDAWRFSIPGFGDVIVDMTGMDVVPEAVGGIDLDAGVVKRLAPVIPTPFAIRASTAAIRWAAKLNPPLEGALTWPLTRSMEPVFYLSTRPKLNTPVDYVVLTGARQDFADLRRTKITAQDRLSRRVVKTLLEEGVLTADLIMALRGTIDLLADDLPDMTVLDLLRLLFFREEDAWGDVARSGGKLPMHGGVILKLHWVESGPSPTVVLINRNHPVYQSKALFMPVKRAYLVARRANLLDSLESEEAELPETGPGADIPPGEPWQYTRGAWLRLRPESTEEEHVRAVADALAAGKPVPAEVLRSYRNLWDIVRGAGDPRHIALEWAADGRPLPKWMFLLLEPHERVAWIQNRLRAIALPSGKYRIIRKAKLVKALRQLGLPGPDGKRTWPFDWTPPLAAVPTIDYLLARALSRNRILLTAISKLKEEANRIRGGQAGRRALQLSLEEARELVAVWRKDPQALLEYGADVLYALARQFSLIGRGDDPLSVFLPLGIDKDLDEKALQEIIDSLRRHASVLGPWAFEKARELDKATTQRHISAINPTRIEAKTPVGKAIRLKLADLLAESRSMLAAFETLAVHLARMEVVVGPDIQVADPGDLYRLLREGKLERNPWALWRGAMLARDAWIKQIHAEIEDIIEACGENPTIDITLFRLMNGDVTPDQVKQSGMARQKFVRKSRVPGRKPKVIEFDVLDAWKRMRKITEDIHEQYRNALADMIEEDRVAPALIETWATEYERDMIAAQKLVIQEALEDLEAGNLDAESVAFTVLGWKDNSERERKVKEKEVVAGLKRRLAFLEKREIRANRELEKVRDLLDEKRNLVRLSRKGALGHIQDYIPHQEALTPETAREKAEQLDSTAFSDYREPPEVRFVYGEQRQGKVRTKLPSFGLTMVNYLAAAASMIWLAPIQKRSVRLANQLPHPISDLFNSWVQRSMGIPDLQEKYLENGYKDWFGKKDRVLDPLIRTLTSGALNPSEDLRLGPAKPIRHAMLTNALRTVGGLIHPLWGALLQITQFAMVMQEMATDPKSILATPLFMGMGISAEAIDVIARHARNVVRILTGAPLLKRDVAREVMLASWEQYLEFYGTQIKRSKMRPTTFISGFYTRMASTYLFGLYLMDLFFKGATFRTFRLWARMKGVPDELIRVGPLEISARDYVALYHTERIYPNYSPIGRPPMLSAVLGRAWGTLRTFPAAFVDRIRGDRQAARIPIPAVRRGMGEEVEKTVRERLGAALGLTTPTRIYQTRRGLERHPGIRNVRKYRIPLVEREKDIERVESFMERLAFLDETVLPGIVERIQQTTVIDEPLLSMKSWIAEEASEDEKAAIKHFLMEVSALGEVGAPTPDVILKKRLRHMARLPLVLTAGWFLAWAFSAPNWISALVPGAIGAQTAALGTLEVFFRWLALKRKSLIAPLTPAEQARMDQFFAQIVGQLGGGRLVTEMIQKHLTEERQARNGGL